VIDDNGNRISKMRAIVRFFIGTLPLYILFMLCLYLAMILAMGNSPYDNYMKYILSCGITLISSSYIIAGFRKDKRTLHDLLAGTYVVYDTPQKK